jgi:alkylated DNA repair protein alkB family protein 6
LSHRRLQTWPSTLTKTNTLLAAPLPAWLHEPIVSPRLDALGCFAGSPHQAPNHVLINEYQPGQGIMPHEDGSAYYPLVATVSLGAPIVLDLYEKDSGNDEKADREPAFRILQEARSLLITTNELYTQYLHGIAERLTDEDLGFDSIANWEMLGDTQPSRNSSYKRQTRVSLTYRDVLKVAKVGNPVKFLTTGR